MEKCTPDIRAHFERYRSTIEAIRIRLSTEVATTINGSITYRNFNKLSKVFKEFEKMCEDWSIECANMSELSNKVIAAFRLRDNIKRYTDFLIRLNFDVPPIPQIDFGSKTINEICSEAEGLNRALHSRDPKSCEILDSMLRIIERNSTLFTRVFERVTGEALSGKKTPYDAKYVDFVYKNTRFEFKKFLNADKAKLSDLIKLRDMTEGAKSNFDEEIEFITNEMKLDSDTISSNVLSQEAVKAGAQLLEMKFVVPSIFECLRQFPNLLDEKGYKRLEELVLKLKVDFKKEFDLNNESYMTKFFKMFRFTQESQEINILLKDAPEYFRNILEITGDMKVSQMRIYKVISKCPDVIKFLEAYRDDESFDKVIAIVRGQLSGYQFGLSILNSLIDSRRTLRPFLGNHDKTIKELCGEVIKALGEGDDISVRLNNIKNANEHLCEIKLWFARAGTTEISMDTILPFINEVVKFGYYKIEMGLSEDTQEPVASLNIRHGDEDSVRVVPASQVSDLTHAMHIFVAKNEMNKGVSSDFDTFYGTTQIVKELLAVYSELRALGHPGYQRVSVQMNRVGAFEEDLYANALEEARGERVSWNKRLTEYKERERRLLFLSNMQILQCGSAIRSIIKEAHEARAKENTDAVFRSLYPYAWACFPEKAFSISSAQVFTAYRAASRTFSTGIGASDEPSAEKHLESVFTFVSTMRTTLRDDRFHGGNSAPEEGEGEGGDGEDGESDRKVRVVQALGFTPCALLHVLIEVFGDRAPHPSRTLYCDRGTSAAEVARFLACVEAFPALSYAAVGVNDLSVEPREALLEWTAQALRPKRRSDESENENGNEPRESKRGALTLIFTGRESLELFGFVPCKREEDELRCEDYTTYEGSGVDFKRATKRLGIETLAVYTGRPQTGKTYAIRKRILSSKVSTRYLGITVSEDFTPAKFIRRYVRAAAAGEQQEQHIVVKVSPYGRVPAFGRFLCDALLWGVLADKGTGEMLCLCGPEAMNSYIQESQRKGALQLYVEVEEAPAEDGETPYTSEESVLSALPGLTAFCTERNRISENAKLYTFGFLTVKEYEQYSFAALCYCEYHNGGSEGSMRSGTTALRALMSRDRATTDELKQFRAHLQTLTPSIAVEKRLARLYCARYQWLKDHLTFLGSAGALDGAASSLVSPAVYCEIIEAEVAQLSGKTLSGFTQHLNIYSESSGTYVDFSKDGKTLAELGRRKGRGALPQVITLAEAMKEPAVLRSALSSGFSDKSVFDILLAQGYVLTPDFVLKLLMLNDFARARQNVVLSGDTGSGKTELLTVFSKLVNLHQSIVPALLTDLGAALKGVPGVGRMSALGKKGHYTEEGLFEAALLLSEAVQFSYISSTPKGRTDILATLARFVAKYADVIEETDAMRLVAESARNATASAVMCQEVQDAVRDVVLEVVQPRFKGTFVKILMHQGVTADAFRREVAGVRTTAARLAQITDRATVVAFIDECTSTTVMSLVKEVIADHTLDGASLPGNIMWIGAFNRNELRKSGDNNTENGNGNRSNIREDFAVRPPPIAFEYSEIVFNAMEDREQQETFVKNLILMRLEQGAFRGFFDEKKKEQKDIWNKELITLCSAVLYCHYYIGKKHDEQRKKALTSAGEGEEEDDAVLRRIHMSLRDIVQCVDLYLYFHRHSAFFVRDAAMSNGGIEQRRLWMHYNSVLLATAVVYYYRMPSAYRKEFEDGLSPRSLGGPRKAYGAFVQEATRQLYADTEIPNGVAPTAALLENLFCTVVCIDAGLPLIIVGPPGCSKTLSFKIAVDNMKGEQSAHATYRGLGHAHPFRYQCSPASTDAEIAGVFQSAIAEQRMHDSGPNKGRQRCVVLLDEAGLPDERRSPLKVLHYVLDHPQVAAVLLSNTPLDAAKTSRMVMVVQERPGPADLRELAWGSICGCDAAGNVRREATLGAIPVAEGERIKCAIEGLCAAYEELTEACRDGDGAAEGARKKTTNGRAWKTYAPAPNYFHLRDFVYMLRYIGREHRKMESFYGFTPAIVARALRRNFGGAASEAQFEAVLGVFFGNLRQKLRRYDGPGLNGIDWECKRGAARRLHATTLDALRECIIDEKVADGEDPNVAPFRNALILDPTESEASVHLLFSLGLCSPENAVIVHVSDFEQDATDEARSSAVVQVKDAMAEGKTVVLLNAMAISTSFYDVFNKNFDMVPVNSAQHGTSESEERSVKMHDGDLTELYKRYRYFANVAVGSYSRPCSVHPDFRVIAHVPISELPRIPAAFLSRFEKYCLSLESALDAVVPGLTAAQQETLILMHSDCEKMIAAASPDAFYGLVPRETLFSLCLQSAIRMKEQESEEVDKEEGAETALRAMLPFHVSDKMAAEDCAGRDGRFRAARAVNFRLLQLGRPEGVLGCSDFFPEPYLREYVVRQEHFSIVRLLRHLFAPSNAEKRPQKLCLFTRTCAELVHLYSDRALQTFVSSMASGDSRTGGGDGNATSMTFVSLAQFPSSRACEDCVVRFKDSADVALVCVADVRECTNDQINFFRKKVDSHISHAGSSKAVVLILHYPPEMQALRASRAGCSAIFLNGWDFAYVDSFGCNSTNDSNNVDSESSCDLSALEVSEAAKEGDEGDKGGRVELLLNPRTWLVRAFNLDVECSEDDVRALFARMFAEKVHGQICHIQRSITQGRKPRLPLSSKFYWGSAKNGSGRPNTRNMTRFLDGVLSSQSYIVDAVLTKFTAMWCGDLLRALVLEACRQISQGRILSGLLSVFQASMSTLLDPVVAMLLRAMCSNYALEPIARITLEGRDPDEAAAERAFVERILCNIGVPPKDVLVSLSLPSAGSGAGAGALTAKIHCLWPFPPYLPMFEVVMNRVNELAAFIKTDTRDRPRHFATLADELAMRIRSDWIGKAAKILAASPHLLTLLKRDIVVFESRLYKVHAPQEALDKDPAAGVLLDLCTSALEALTEGHKDSLAHLFLAADMKRQRLAFFVEAIAKLQHIYPPLDVRALPGVFDFGALERDDPAAIENAVLRVGVEGMWNTLRSIGEGAPGTADEDDLEAMLVSFEKTYRLLLAQMPPRNDLYTGDCINTKELAFKADVVRIAELFLLNVSPFKNEALPHIRTMFSRLNPDRAGPLALSEAVEIALAMSEGKPEVSVALFVRDVIHEFTEATKVPEGIPVAARRDLSYFFGLISEEGYARMLPPVWAVNFLYLWIKNKPTSWKSAMLSDLFKLLPNNDYESIDLLKTDLTFFSPQDFVYYHICVQVLNEGTISDLVQFASQAGEAPTIRAAACTAAITKRIAATITNSGGNAVMDFSRPLVAFFNRHKAADSRVKNVDGFLITSIESETKCLGFLQNKSALTFLGMEEHFIVATSTARMSYPLFTLIATHPLHNEYAFFAKGLKSGDKEGFISSLGKKIEGERVNKPRLKRICKMMLLASMYYEFFDNNIPVPFDRTQLNSIARIIGITPEEANVYKLVSNGWLDVPNQELDSFLALFSTQFRSAKESDITICQSMFTYYRAFDIDKIFLTKCPGSAYHRNNVDCGFQAMVRPGVILSPAKIMGDILQYRLALNSIIWTSFAWAFTATPEKALNYVKRDRKHSPCSNLMTYGEDMSRYSGGRRNEYNTFKQYAYDRSTMFYGMFSLCSDSVTKNITPGHFMCEVLDTLWFVIDSGKSNNFVGICREESEAIRIEDGMREIFDLVSKDYIKRKNAIQEMESSSDVIKNRQERTAFLSTPIVSWETIDSWITSQTGEVQEMNAVAAYLCTKDQEIAGLAQVPTLINFYLRLHDELSYRVAKEDLSLPMMEVLRKYDGEGLLRDDWEAFKTAWATVVEAIHQEGCAGGMAERGFEFQSAAINDETLFLVLISDSNNNDDPEGEIYKMIKLGVANVQERVLEKLTTNYEKLNPNDMLFDSGTKSDFIATALNKKTPNNNALLDVRGIDYARECASLFVECDSTLSRSSFSVIIPKFVIEIIRKTASGAVPMNKNESLREFLLCDFKAVDKASIDRATESRLSEQELIRSLATTMAGHLAEGGASMLRARLASFSVPKYGERLKPGWAEAELRGANEGLLNSISGVVVSLIDFAAAVERHELEDDSDVVPENLGHLERDTVDQAYVKAFGCRIPNYAVRQKIGFLEMRFLADVGAKVLRKLETHDWLFEGEKREYSVPLSRSVEAELDEIKKAVLSAADESDRKASVWCNTVEEVVRALSDRKALRQSQPLSLLYHEKQAFRDVRARSLLPERIKSSYYVGYMKWLYGLLCELKMKTVHEPSGSGKEEEHPWL